MFLGFLCFVITVATIDQSGAEFFADFTFIFFYLA